jgi:glyceraldehyde-3-phosphate dehydrogenase (NADP+)
MISRLRIHARFASLLLENECDTLTPLSQTATFRELLMPSGSAQQPREYKMLLGGEWTARPETISIRNPYSGDVIGVVPSATVDDIRRAIACAEESLKVEFPLLTRADVLTKAASFIEARKDEYARVIALEGSKTIRESQREPVRTANLLRLSAEESKRITGQTLPFESRAGSENRVGYYFRFPVGIIAGITPFNDPLAMAGHNIGPAIAAGNAIVLKPSALTPLSPLMLAEDLVKAGLPPGRLSIITGHGSQLGEALVSDPRVRMVTFTGGGRYRFAGQPMDGNQESPHGTWLQFACDRYERCKSRSGDTGDRSRCLCSSGRELYRRPEDPRPERCVRCVS